MINAFLSQFRWYRRWRKGEWYLVRIDLGDRPMFWTQSPCLAESHNLYSVLEQESYPRSDRNA